VNDYEWISSVDLENAAMDHPDVALAAVVGVHHPKWDERPILIVKPTDGARPTKERILDFLKDKVAKWRLPDDVLFVDDIPLTATGKISKLTLRERFRDYELPNTPWSEPLGTQPATECPATVFSQPRSERRQLEPPAR
jgi:fatty-acyl-CoA synthase